MRKRNFRAVPKRCAACGSKSGETFYEGEFTFFDCNICHKATRLGRAV